MPRVEGLITSTCATNDFYAVWAAHEHAPVSHVADEEGTCVILRAIISDSHV